MSQNISWIHCNICTHLFKHKDRRFFVLSCQPKHLLCHICMGKTNQGKMCPLCKSKATYMEITNSMNPHAKQYFDYQGCRTNQQEMKRIRDFQMYQMNRLVTATNGVQVKLRKAKEYKERVASDWQKKTAKTKKARVYRRQLQERLKNRMKFLRDAKKVKNISRHSTSSGYSSQSMGDKSSETMIFNAPVDDVFEKPKKTSSFFGDSAGTPLINRHCKEKLFGATPKLSPKIPFSSQKASTPNDKSRTKVLTQEFSFQSTPSTISRHRR
ncbi:RING finger protein vilya [Culicoides brevitarsis]|uniref:RING finger protein vilya n=1 Tax=Culicoides brevitarsis TaxID=469753 RepID=UPI00307B41CF